MHLANSIKFSIQPFLRQNHHDLVFCLGVLLYVSVCLGWQSYAVIFCQGQVNERSVKFILGEVFRVRGSCGEPHPPARSVGARE
jgi:hypothetical protein